MGGGYCRREGTVGGRVGGGYCRREGGRGVL